MLSFKQFFERSAEETDLQDTLQKIPLGHRGLVANYNVKFHGGNTLAGDDEHIGYMDPGNREIAIAAPFNYGREFTLLHEIAHVVYQKKMTPQLRKEWAEMIQRTKAQQIRQNPAKDSLKQSPEELFSHVYANFYTKHRIMTYFNPEWFEFIKNRVPQ